MTKNKKRLGLAVPESLYREIADMAERQGKTINSTCLDIFWDHFTDQTKKKGGIEQWRKKRE